MADVADRILAAIKTHLAAVSGVAGAYLQPLHLLTASQLPALIIDDVKDEIVEETGFFPIYQKHNLSFSVLACQMASAASFSSDLGTLHEAAKVAIAGTLVASNLDGMLTRVLSIKGSELFTDAESMEKPVGGWRIAVSCTFNTRSDQPGHTEKELTLP